MSQARPCKQIAASLTLPAVRFQFPLAAALSRTVSPSVSVASSLAPLSQPSPSTSPGSVQSPLPASPSDALKASPYGRLGALFPGEQRSRVAGR